MKMQMKKRWRKLGVLMAAVMMMSACSLSEQTEGTGANVSEPGIEKVEETQDVFGGGETETEQNRLETEASWGETEQEQAETKQEQPEAEQSQPESETAPESEKPVYQPAIGQLGEPVEYPESAELALNGMTSVVTDYLTIDPVNNVSYVVCEGHVEIYYCGIYCGYFMDTYYGKTAWTGDGRDEINRVFGGSKERAESLDWDVERVNPYLKLVCSYDAQSYGDVGTMTDFQKWGVYENAGEWYGRDLFGWGALFGMEKAECGYVLWLSRGMVNEELARDLMSAIKLDGDSFTQAARDAMDSSAAKAEHAYALNDLKALAEEGKVTLKITDGDFTYVVPKPYVAIKEGEDCWGIYQFVRLVGAQKIGQVSIRDAVDETAGTKSTLRAVFSDEQRKGFAGKAAQEDMTDDFCWLSTTMVLSDDGQRVMEIERLQFGDTEYAPEGWQDAAWAEFEDPSQIQWPSGDKYTGFLDRLYAEQDEGWRFNHERYQTGDYDGDEKKDRLYMREVGENTVRYICFSPAVGPFGWLKRIIWVHLISISWIAMTGMMTGNWKLAVRFRHMEVRDFRHITLRCMIRQELYGDKWNCPAKD